MKVLSLLLLLSLSARAQEPQGEVVLPFTGRKIDLTFARDLYKMPVKDAVKKLREKGIRVVEWKPEQLELSLYEGGAEALSDREKSALCREFVELAEQRLEFDALSLRQGDTLGGLTISQDTVVVVNSPRIVLGENLMMHEYVHFELLKLPPPTFKGRTLPSLSEANRAYQASLQAAETNDKNLKDAELTAAGVRKNAAGYELWVVSDYHARMVELVTLLEEMDVHVLFQELGFVNARHNEVLPVAAHLSDRLQHAQDANTFYKELSSFDDLTAKTREYGERSLQLESELKDLATRFRAKVRDILSPAQYQAWTRSREARRLGQLSGL